MKKVFFAISIILIGFSGLSHAAIYNLDVYANLTDGNGSGINFNTGQSFTVSVANTDLWSGGPIPRWSNADGLIADLYATGSDESGKVSGTLIGTDFGMVERDGFSAPWGALVGGINGNFVLIGTHFSGTAWDTGELELFYWDANGPPTGYNGYGDNTDYVTVVIDTDPVPVPGALLLLGSGLLGLMSMIRKR